MPQESPGLPTTQAAADQVQLLRALQQAQERSLSLGGGGRPLERGREVASTQVPDAEEVRGGTIQGESRGAHSFNLNQEKKGKQEEAPAETPPDPDGRGAHLDLRG